jgi:hypothetical protein
MVLKTIETLILSTNRLYDRISRNTRATGNVGDYVVHAVSRFIGYVMPTGTVSRLAATILLCCSSNIAAHGNVVADGDRCLMQFGFYSAQFTIFQPRTREHRKFCEDIPDVTESVFVMEYLHKSMREVPVDFRIIRDRESRGRFVRWEDIEAVDDLQAETVFYQPPVIRQDGVLAVLHQFETPGNYIGIVTTVHPTKNLQYNAVFPFRVGGAGWGYWPWFVALALLVQLNYWIMSGGYTRWRGRQARRKTSVRQNR